MHVLFETENNSSVASARLWRQMSQLCGLCYHVEIGGRQQGFEDFTKAKFELLSLLCYKVTTLHDMKDKKNLQALGRDIERLYKMNDPFLMRSYRATVLFKGEKIQTILKVVQTYGDKWRILYKKPSGSYASWRGCTEIFDDRVACQKRLDEEAFKRGFEEVD